MYEAQPTHFENQRRRSERVSQPFPIVVRGIDLLGQPFEERTMALAYNFHGCRYSSKHHLQQDAWVTLEVQRYDQPQSVQARVAWTQRPQSVRDFFQVGVEFESPSNIWGLEYPPQDWCPGMPSQPQTYQQYTEPPSSESSSATIDSLGFTNEKIAPQTPFSSSVDAGFAPPSGQPPDFAMQLSPEQETLLRNLNEELRRRAQEAVETAAARVTSNIRASVEEVHQQKLATAEEFFRTWKEEFARTRDAESFAGAEQLSETQQNFLNNLKAQFEDRFGEARQLLDELDQKSQLIRSETDAISQADEPRSNAPELAPSAVAWNERLELELTLAQSQWNELLQASLDRGTQRLASQLSEHSKDVLRSAEQRLAERFQELRQPLSETADEARSILRDLRAELEEEMSRARGSLVDIEHVAGRIKDYSAQLEASSHDTLNELHRRLENILESQTGQLSRHADQLVHELTQRLSPTLEGLERQLVERAVAEVETRLSPRMERVPELIRELSAHAIEADESLRLHRERLRQATENQQRDLSAQASTVVANLRNDFETSGKEVLAKWTEELNANGARASQTSSEAIGHASEWFQEEARARLQVIVEQSLAAASTNLDEMALHAAAKHADALNRASGDHLAGAQIQIDNAVSDAVARSHSRFDDAAQAAAASFGQVLRDISDQEARNFTLAAQNSVQERTRELEFSAQQVIGNLSTATEASLETFRTRVSSEIESGVVQGRQALASEMGVLRDQFSAERENRQKEWAEGLDQLSIAATAKHEDRLQTACDTWIVSSVRRLNEHGQSTIESLMRLTDQALRDSCSKVFENLAEMMRNRNANAAGMGAFVPMAGREGTENPTAQ